MSAAAAITIVVMAVTLGLMLTRPRGLNEAWFAAAGAGALLVTGVLPRDAPIAAMHGTAEVLIFLAAMMLVTGVVERAGVIEIVAERIAALAGHSVRTLYIAMFQLSAVITATMSLDITIILVTPILYAVARRRRLDPIPFLFACAFVANIGSLIFPVSNLTNLLLVNRLELRYADFVHVMWLPNTVALATTLLLFLWLFRDQLRSEAAASEDEVVPGVASAPWRAVVGGMLVLVIVGLLVAGFAGWPVWIPASIGALVLVGAATVTRRIHLTDVVRDLAPPLFVFVIAMTMLVQAFSEYVLRDVTVSVPDSLPGRIVAGIIAATLASNVINNVPATVIAGEVLLTVPPDARDVMAYASLIGANIGPALTTYGSLATMLWLSIIRKRGTSISTRTYLRVSLITVPVVLLSTGLSLWLSLTLWG